MRLTPLLLLVVCGAIPMHMQSAAQTTDTPTANAAITKRHPVVKPAVRPPASARPSAKARFSTTQRMAAANNQPPLKVLPDFNVSDREGHMVASKRLQRATHWLLIYRREKCIPCDRLMNVLVANGSASVKNGTPYVIVVAGNTSESVERVRANYGSMSDATWLGDKGGQAFAALKPHGTPMIYAMDGNKIAWNVPGNLGDPSKVEKMAVSWTTSSGTPSADSSNAASSSAPSTTTTQ